MATAVALQWRPEPRFGQTTRAKPSRDGWLILQWRPEPRFGQTSADGERHRVDPLPSMEART